jgi:hypothetical protein
MSEIPFGDAADAGWTVFHDTVKKLNAAHALVYAMHHTMASEQVTALPSAVQAAYQRALEVFRPTG